MVKCVDKRDTQAVEFKKLDSAVVFIATGGEVYMKISPCGSNFNAVKMSNGIPDRFAESAKVVPCPNAELFTNG